MLGFFLADQKRKKHVKVDLISFSPGLVGTTGSKLSALASPHSTNVGTLSIVTIDIIYYFVNGVCMLCALVVEYLHK